jgi:intron-binding protein aquarius
VLIHAQVGNFHVTFVSKPQLGSDVPCEVRAEVGVSLDRVAPHIRSEWDGLREHDIVFMITLTEPASQYGEHKKDSVRGAEVVQVLDEAKKPLFESGLDGSVRARQPVGMKRTFRLLLDPAQYHADVLAGNTKVYESFNLVVREGSPWFACIPGFHLWECMMLCGAAATIRQGKQLQSGVGNDS